MVGRGLFFVVGVDYASRTRLFCSHFCSLAIPRHKWGVPNQLTMSRACFVASALDFLAAFLTLSRIAFFSPRHITFVNTLNIALDGNIPASQGTAVFLRARAAVDATHDTSLSSYRKRIDERSAFVCFRRLFRVNDVIL